MNMKLKLAVVFLVVGLVLAGCAGARSSRDGTGGGGNPPPAPPGPIQAGELVSLRMVTESAGWALTGTAVLRTNDGGETWADVTPESGTGTTVGAASFPDADRGWFTAVREGDPAVVIFRTADGGRSWQKAAAESRYPFFAVKLQFIDARCGWLMVSQGVAAGSERVEIYRTGDGGASWSLAAAADPDSRKPGGLPFGGLKNGISFRDEENGWVTGYSHGPGIFLYQTSDGGETWREQSLPVPPGYGTEGGSASAWPPVFFDGKDGFLPVRFGAQQPPATVFYATHDGGATWNPTAPVTPENNKGLVWSFADARHGFATDGDRLYLTADGGRKWTEITPDTSLVGVLQLEFINSKKGWALVSEPGSTRTRLLRTVDGGRTWKLLHPAGGASMERAKETPGAKLEKEAESG